jgi:hypothetical protein
MIMRLTIRVLGFMYVFFIASCAPTRIVKPLAKKEHQVSANLGGPLIKFGPAIMPIPFTTVNYGYGLNDKVSLTGSLHTTSALFKNLQLDAGAVFSIYRSDSLKWGLSAGTHINFASNISDKDSRYWPQLDINAYKHYGKKNNLMYAGISSWFETAATYSCGKPISNRWIPIINFGHIWQKGKMSYSIELKMLAPGTYNRDIVVEYVSFMGKRGATGLYFQIGRKF